MSVFDLLFLFSFLASLVTLITAAVVAVRGRRAKAGKILVAWAVCVAVGSCMVAIDHLIACTTLVKGVTKLFVEVPSRLKGKSM